VIWILGDFLLITKMNEEWEDLDEKYLSTIRLCLTDDILFNIVGEDTT
jgi:hypothetical protein